jgi:hypothetical protein
MIDVAPEFCCWSIGPILFRLSRRDMQGSMERYGAAIATQPPVRGRHRFPDFAKRQRGF